MKTQPKFKFGDFLQEESRGSKSFCVSIIEKSEDGYYYGGEDTEDAYLEETLKLIERPKRKVKKRFYMMAYECNGQDHCGGVMVDEKFRDRSGDEVMKGYERKIMENSPYIEIEVDE